MSMKPDRGIKRRCQNADCALPFYDLGRIEFDCPTCGSAFSVTAAAQPVHQAAASNWGGRRDRRAPKPIVAPPLLPDNDADGQVEILETEAGSEAVDEGEQAPVGEEAILEQQDDDPVIGIDDIPINRESD